MHYMRRHYQFLAITISLAVFAVFGLPGLQTSMAHAFKISGEVTSAGVGVSGVTISLTGAATATTTTNATGRYTFGGLGSGNYTVTPTKTGMTFLPPSANVTIAGRHKEPVDFAAALASNISGRVTSPGGTGVYGVTMSLTGTATATTTTDIIGNYAFTGLANGPYTVTPSLAGYSFAPTSWSNTVTSANYTANFATDPTVTLPGYSMPLLAPASQLPHFQNVIPNALASYYTYTPYTDADAQKVGFPAGICGVTEDCYTITVKKFPQQLALPTIFGGGPGLLNTAGTAFGAATQVYGYGSGGSDWTPPPPGSTGPVTGNAPSVGSFTGEIWHFPAPTIRATKGRPIRVQWLNELPNEKPSGFDPTVDCGMNAPDCFPYNRIVTHVHGAHVKDDSDGYTGAWFTPEFAITGPGWQPSTYGPEGTYRYPMDQEAGTIWYHDQAIGVTHNNTQMGLAGFFPITDANEQQLITNNILPTGDYELGLLLQDRMFDTDGQFAMPDAPLIDAAFPGCDQTSGVTRLATCSPLFMKAADGHLIPYDSGTLVDPTGINLDAPFLASSTSLKYFGNMPVVNGVTYGTYDVEPRRYRMRFIGGTDSRTWIMKLVRRDTGAVIPFWQIGSEQGLLNNPVSRTQMDLLPGERLDVIVDLTDIPEGTSVVMQNIGPDTLYGGPDTLLDPLYQPSVNIPEIMEFNVIALSGADHIAAPSALTNLRPVNGPITTLTATIGVPVRNVSLEEGIDQYGRVMPTIDGRGFMPVGIPATEVIRLNDTEEWNIINNTADAHPIHLHLVQFQVISRQAFDSFVPAGLVDPFDQPQYTGIGAATPPDPWDAGWKDTIDVPPGTVVKVRAKFDIAGDRYIWHSHILSQEEYEIMRPLVVFVDGVCGTSNNGTFISAPGTDLCGDGSTPALTPTATGWTWTCTGQFDGSTDANCSANLGYLVTTTTTNGTITSTVNPVVIHDSTTTVTGTANDGYYFSGVSGCDGSGQVNGDEAIISFSYTTGAIITPCTVTATFAAKTYTTLTITRAGTGDGTVGIEVSGTCGTISWTGKIGTVVCDPGAQVTLNGQPNILSDPSAAAWSGACTGNNPCVISMIGDRSATITFNSKAGFTWYLLPELRVEFEGSAMNVPVTSWQWDFGDGASSAVQNPLNQYAAPGVYQVTLIAAGAGISPSATQPVTVNACSLGVSHVAGSTYYGTVTGSFAAAAPDDVIELQATNVGTAPAFSDPVKPVTIRGGFDCDYLVNRWVSSITGPVTLSGGAVTIDNVVIQ